MRELWNNSLFFYSTCWPFKRSPSLSHTPILCTSILEIYGELRYEKLCSWLANTGDCWYVLNRPIRISRRGIPTMNIFPSLIDPETPQYIPSAFPQTAKHWDRGELPSGDKSVGSHVPCQPLGRKTFRFACSIAFHRLRTQVLWREACLHSWGTTESFTQSSLLLLLSLVGPNYLVRPLLSDGCHRGTHICAFYVILFSNFDYQRFPARRKCLD